MEHRYLGDLGALPDLSLDSSDDETTDGEDVEIMRVSAKHRQQLNSHHVPSCVLPVCV